MNLQSGKFHDLFTWISGGSGHLISVGMAWGQNDGPVRDPFGRRFVEVAKVRGVTRVLADWKDGMIMVSVE